MARGTPCWCAGRAAGVGRSVCYLSFRDAETEAHHPIRLTEAHHPIRLYTRYINKARSWGID